MTDRLPLEVYKRIIDHLQPISDNPTLSALCRTSHVLQPVAERLLYLSLYLVGARSVSAILATFLSRSSLAILPRNMYIHPSERRGDRTSASYWERLEELLHRAGRHLEVLCITGQDADVAFSSWVLRGMYHASGSLNALRISFWWDSEVAAFLESAGARGLTRVETSDMNPVAAGQAGEQQQQQQLPAPLELSRGAVPHLNVVDAPPAALYLLVPGRPVTLARMRLGPATTLQTLPPVPYLLGECLARSSAPRGVTAIDFGDLTYGNRAETYSLEVLELAPRFLPYLEFISRVNFPWTKDVPTSRMHKALIRLPYLHTLELVVSHMHPPVDAYWELATASELRMFSPSLKQIVFWKTYDRRRWVWNEQEEDWVVAGNQDVIHYA